MYTLDLLILVEPKAPYVWIHMALTASFLSFVNIQDVSISLDGSRIQSNPQWCTCSVPQHSFQAWNLFVESQFNMN